MIISIHNKYKIYNALYIFHFDPEIYETSKWINVWYKSSSLIPSRIQVYQTQYISYISTGKWLLKKNPHTFNSLLFRSLEECFPSSWRRSYFFEAEHLKILLLFPFTFICFCLVKRSEHPTDRVLQLNPSSCTIPHVPICTILHFTVKENVPFVLKALNSNWSKLRKLTQIYIICLEEKKTPVTLYVI